MRRTTGTALTLFIFNLCRRREGPVQAKRIIMLMRHRLLFLLAVLTFIVPSLRAEFSFEYEGHTLVYDVIDEEAKTCMVVMMHRNWNMTNLIIPAVVNDGTNSYVVTSIGENAFEDCGELISVVIPESVTSIGNYAFSGCWSLLSISLPDSLTSIGEYTFSHCVSLSSIIIPVSVTSIGKGAFLDCESLLSINIPDSVTSLEDNIFFNCYELTSVVIPESVTTIGDYSFCSCTSLSSIVIPASVIYIGKGTFAECISLSSINIPDSITYIGDEAFLNCHELLSVRMPKSITIIGEYTFHNCFSLSSIKLPDSITSIGDYAFYCCERLTSIVIPESVTSIGKGAFADCPALTSVTCESKEPISKVWESSFEMLYQSATLYVPQESVDLYRKAKVWSKFWYINDKPISGIDIIERNTEGIDYSLPYEVYNLDGVKVGNSRDGLAKGIYVVRQGRLARKIGVE